MPQLVRLNSSCHRIYRGSSRGERSERRARHVHVPRSLLILYAAHNLDTPSTRFRANMPICLAKKTRK